MNVVVGLGLLSLFIVGSFLLVVLVVGSNYFQFATCCNVVSALEITVLWVFYKSKYPCILVAFFQLTELALLQCTCISDMGSSTLVLVLKYNKYSPSQYLQSI